MLRRHEKDILNYFRMPIDNGTVEGLNNKAKLIIHRAYGFRTAKNYIRNLYHCMADLPLPPTVSYICVRNRFQNACLRLGWGRVTRISGRIARWRAMDLAEASG